MYRRAYVLLVGTATVMGTLAVTAALGLAKRLAGELREILRAAGTTALMVTHDHDEAFTVADRLAVMRAGRLVQDGPIDAVWRHPVDADTALFLGYARVVEGAAAARVAEAAGLPGGVRTLALRRSALALAPRGPLTATVLSSRMTPEQVRLEAEVEGIGVVDAVAGLDAPPAVGERVSLVVDPTRLAVISGS